MEVEIHGNKYSIKDLTADEVMDILGDSHNDQKTLNKILVSKCTGMSMEELAILPAKFFLPLLNKCNENNGIGYFQQAKVS